MQLMNFFTIRSHTPAHSPRPPAGRAAWLGLAMMAFLAGCAGPSGGSHALSGVKDLPAWDRKAEVYGEAAKAPPVSKGEATVLFFRDGQGVPTKTVNVYLNDRFHTALLPLGHTRQPVCAGQARLALVYDDAALRHQGRTLYGQALRFEPGQLYVFKVRQRDGQAVVEPSTQAEFEASGTQAQVHAVSRTAACQAGA